MLRIENLHVHCDDVKIIDNFSLHISPGELHMIMGPNGAGKSTFAKVLSGDPSLSVSAGKISLEKQDLLTLSPEERARAGLFVGFQHPPEIPGVNNKLFLRDAYNSCRRYQYEAVTTEDFEMLLSALQESYEFEVLDHFFERNVNEGFSGGERKKNEIFQMLIMEPKMAVLDEPDSGLDVDSLRAVCKTLERYREIHPENSMCIITHNPKLGQFLHPDIVHLFLDGNIALSGGGALMQDLEYKSYQEILNRAFQR